MESHPIAPAAPYVTILVPCRNERRFIASCLESILANDYPRDLLEILVLDGMSDDGTREILREFAGKHSVLRVLDNAHKTVPAGLNLGLSQAKGQVILRMDAHNAFPSHYVSALVGWLLKSGADNVGGMCVTRAGGPGPMARAIARGMSHPLGVGNSYFRIGVTEPRLVDTVPFGCYRSEVFREIGKFDEDLIRNQDDEFNLRLIKHGGKILLVPDVTCEYFARDSLAKLWKMYGQYGYFKPLVIRKLRGLMTLRQIIPSVFILSLLGCALGGAFFRPLAWAFLGILGSYGVVTVTASVIASFRMGFAPGSALMLVFPTLHLSYGFGFLMGAVNFLVLRRNPRRRGAEVPLSR